MSTSPAPQPDQPKIDNWGRKKLDGFYREKDGTPSSARWHTSWCLAASIAFVFLLGLAIWKGPTDKVAIIIPALPGILMALTGWNVAMYTVNRGGNAADNFAGKPKTPAPSGQNGQ